MDAFVFQADIYCADCGEAIRKRLTDEGKAPADPDDESSYDSDEFPKGPYEDGGGEADTPQHCGSGDGCINAIAGNDDTEVGAFLENPLTKDGVEYVWQNTRNHSVISEMWLEHYKWVLQEKYNEAEEKIRREYGPKMMQLMTELANMCREEGLEVDGPFECDADEYSVELMVKRTGADEEDSMDVRLEIDDSDENDGSLDGVTFSMRSCMNGGLIKGPQLSPYNYSPDVWVDVRDSKAIAERWSLMEQADLTECVYLINKELPKKS